VPSTTRQTHASDGTPIQVRHWAPGGEPWAHLVLVHGLAEHSGRYEHVGGWLAEAGLDVTADDLRGFGASGGRRAFVDRWDRYHDDLEERLVEIRATADGLPIALYGHSMGGLVAFGYTVAEPARPLPDALILSAPAVDSSLPRWQRQLARVLTRVAPTYRVRNAFDGTILSRDASVAERYLDDPLNYHSTTARLGAEAIREQARVTAAFERLTVPTLVVHGGADRLVPTASSEPFDRLRNVTRRTYADLRHETHNEPEGEAVVAETVAWLRSVLESSATEDRLRGARTR
jgi:alpha-beta hydrolase superfamily lysophospholipase